MNGHSKVISKVATWGFILVVVAIPTVLQSTMGLGVSPILTGSMSPYSAPGDAFLTEKTQVSELKVGDIVTLFSDQRQELFAHRIVEIRNQNGLIRVITKGDANLLNDSDPYIASPTEVVAKTIATVPKLGSVIVYGTSLQGRQAGLALLVMANVLALILFVFKKKDSKGKTISEKVYKDLFQNWHDSATQEKKKAVTYKKLYEEARYELQLVKGE